MKGRSYIKKEKQRVKNKKEKEFQEDDEEDKNCVTDYKIEKVSSYINNHAFGN